MPRSPAEPLLADRVLVVADIGSNHDGDLARALALVDAAAGAGADAVQVDAYHAARRAAAVAAGPGRPRDAAEASAHLARVELRTEWYARVRDRAATREVRFLATPFDPERAALLAALGVPAFPTALADLANDALLRAVGRFARPVLLAVGRGDRAEVERALAAIADGAGAPSRRPPVVLVAGPGADGSGDVRGLDALGERFACRAGWSDVGPSDVLALAAVALGARVVVKPLTDDRRRRGPGHAGALEPPAFRAFAAAVRECERARREVAAADVGAGVTIR